MELYMSDFLSLVKSQLIQNFLFKQHWKQNIKIKPMKYVVNPIISEPMLFKKKIEFNPMA
jgi:hypothetical protein